MEVISTISTASTKYQTSERSLPLTKASSVSQVLLNSRLGIQVQNTLTFSILKFIWTLRSKHHHLENTSKWQKMLPPKLHNPILM